MITTEQLQEMISEHDKELLRLALEHVRAGWAEAMSSHRQQKRAAARFAAMKAGQIIEANSSLGEVTAIVNTTGVPDLQNDLLVPGAFADVIAAGTMPAVCWQHDMTKVLGRATYLEELEPGDPRVFFNQTRALTDPLAGGLLCKMQFAMSTQGGRETFDLVQGGFIDEWSIAFLPSPTVDYGGTTVPDKKTGGMRISQVDDLLEVSPVIRGASLQTGTLTAKAFPILRKWLQEKPMQTIPYKRFAAVDGPELQAEVVYRLTRALVNARSSPSLGLLPMSVLLSLNHAQQNDYNQVQANLKAIREDLLSALDRISGALGDEP